MPIPAGITRKHVERAIEMIDGGLDHAFGPSVTYDLLYEGNRYPPKAVVGIAAKLATDVELKPSEFHAGESANQANGLLRRLGFSVVGKGSQRSLQSGSDSIQGGFQPEDFDVLARYPKSVNWATIPEEDRNLLKGLREKLKQFAVTMQRELQLTTPLEAFASHPTQSGRNAQHYWSCVFPAAAEEKSFGLQVGVIVKAKDVEFGLFVGSGAAQKQDKDALHKTHHYRDAYILAQHVIRSSGRYLSHGTEASWAFLIRTPEMVEKGLLAVLGARCEGWKIDKKGIQLGTTSMTLNPDIVVDGGYAVADVKYKLAGEDWNRSDLYQAVAFAAGYGTSHAAIVDFREAGRPSLPTVPFGDTEVVQLSWPADGALDADQAASSLANSFSTWLSNPRAA